MKKHYTQSLTGFLWLCFLSSICYADCTQDSVLQAIHEEYEPQVDLLITCKSMPDQNQKSIVAFVRPTGTHEYTLKVFVVNNRIGQTVNRFVDEEPAFEGSGDPERIIIDTARYIVVQKKRAFGVRVGYSLNSWDSTEELNLFIEEENQLKEIMKGLMVRFSSGHLCVNSDTEGVISISNVAHNHFYELPPIKRTA